MKKRTFMAMAGAALMLTAACSNGNPEYLTPSVVIDHLPEHNNNDAQPEATAQPNLNANPLWGQTTKLREMTVMHEERTHVALAADGRYGELVLRAEDVLIQKDPNRKRYTGDLEVVFRNTAGDVRMISEVSGMVLEEDVKPWGWQVFAFETYDLLLLQTDQTQFNKHENPKRTVRAFMVSASGEAAPLVFRDSEGEESEELVIHSDFPIEQGEDTVTVHAAVPEVLRLVFAVDAQTHSLMLMESEDVDEEYRKAKALAEEQAIWLEELLLYKVGENQLSLEPNPVSYEELLERVSEEAQQQDSFRYMEDHREQHQRAFRWGVSDVRLDEQAGELSFTLAANLYYAIGRDARLQVQMVSEDGVWRVRSFGSLYIERVDEYPQVMISAG